MSKSKQENSEKKKDTTKAKTTKAPKTALKRVVKVLLVMLFIFTLVQLSKHMEDNRILRDLDDPMIGKEVAGLRRSKILAVPPSCFGSSKPTMGRVSAEYKVAAISEAQLLESLKTQSEKGGWQDVRYSKENKSMLFAEKNEKGLVIEVSSDLVKISIDKLYRCP